MDQAEPLAVKSPTLALSAIDRSTAWGLPTDGMTTAGEAGRWWMRTRWPGIKDKQILQLQSKVHSPFSYFARNDFEREHEAMRSDSGLAQRSATATSPANYSPAFHLREKQHAATPVILSPVNVQQRRRPTLVSAYPSTTPARPTSVSVEQCLITC